MGIPSEAGFDFHSRFRPGERNLISDVPGVTVGHSTIHTETLHTGVTALLPRPSDWFHRKCVAGATVLNGFGKSAGLVQLQELGTLEAPILLTNTLAVGTCLTGMVRAMLRENPDIAFTASTVNCVVTECNDGSLSDIRSLPVREENVTGALENASDDFAEGAVGGGAGMVCMGFKGGIGSASRVLELGGEKFTVGGLALTNFGGPGSLTVGGRHLGEEILNTPPAPFTDRGSVILILATDLPLSARQCRRLSSRAGLALGRVGSTMGNGSGDIAIAFSTANEIPEKPDGSFFSPRLLRDACLDDVFTAGIEALEESIVSALWHAETVTGFCGRRAQGLRETMAERGIR